VAYAIEFADRVIGIHAGRVVFEGRPESLDAQALAQIYPGLEGTSDAEAGFKEVLSPAKRLAS
jgi:phosphonate transport system ATP-binding protein